MTYAVPQIALAPTFVNVAETLISRAPHDWARHAITSLNALTGNNDAERLAALWREVINRHSTTNTAGPFHLTSGTATVRVHIEHYPIPFTSDYGLRSTAFIATGIAPELRAHSHRATYRIPVRNDALPRSVRRPRRIGRRRTQHRPARTSASVSAFR